MSSYMVEDAEADFLVTAYMILVDPSFSDATLLGQVLLTTNAAGVQACYEGRYPDDDEANMAQANAYQFRRWEGSLDHDLIAKTIVHLSYQSAEYRGFADGIAASFLRRLSAEVAKVVQLDGIQRGLPKLLHQHQRHPWGIDRHPGEQEAA